MTSLRKGLTLSFLGVVALSILHNFCLAAEPVNSELRALAAQARNQAGQAALRSYAETAQSSEDRGLGFLILGYREYEGGEFVKATEDFRQASARGFSLADVAEYYAALAAEKSGQPGKAAETLDGFASRYPESPLRREAFSLYAQSLVEAGEPGRAAAALAADPRMHERPELLLLLAQAQEQAEWPSEAAKTLGEIYTSFPDSGESKAAEKTLQELRARLGEKFPRPTEEAESLRAERLFGAGRAREALKEFDALLRAHPASPLGERWKVGRGRCLLRLRRNGEAIDALTAVVPKKPELDAERLAALVDAYIRHDDATAMEIVLEQFQKLYPQSPSYVSALAAAGNFFARQGDWKAAIEHHRRVVELSPQTDSGREAHWRVAWSLYMLREREQAGQALAEHIRQYPASPHLAGALYWLGRLAETRASAVEARALFATLRERFVHSYYALQAAPRLKELGREQGRASNSADTLDSSPVPELVASIPPSLPPPLRPCEPGPASDALGPFLALKAVSLDELAEQYLNLRLRDVPDAPDLLLALARLQSADESPAPALINARRATPKFSEYKFSTLAREVWDLLYPQEYWALVERNAQASGLDPYLVMALIRQESAFNPRAVSRANARGLMQILPRTVSRGRGIHRAVTRRLFDPAYNMRFGCRYLRAILDENNGEIAQALAAYNAGQSRVDGWTAGRTFNEPAEFIENIPIPETRSYVEWVLRDAEIYREILTGTAKFAGCEMKGRPAKRPERRGVSGKGNAPRVTSQPSRTSCEGISGSRLSVRSPEGAGDCGRRPPESVEPRAEYLPANGGRIFGENIPKVSSKRYKQGDLCSAGSFLSREAAGRLVFSDLTALFVKNDSYFRTLSPPASFFFPCEPFQLAQHRGPLPPSHLAHGLREI